MDEKLKFDYYYGIEAEQFSFFRVPRILIKDKRFKKLSNDAKLLYGLMIDRMALSMKNEWLDDKNRAYIIYTLESITEDLNCGRDKAMKVLAELDSNKGIGLIERVRRGLGKPDIIYVKNFVGTIKRDGTDGEETNPDSVEKRGNEKNDFKKSEKSTSGDFEDSIAEAQKGDFKESGRSSLGNLENQIAEVEEVKLQKSEKSTSESLENRLQKVEKSDSNYNNINYTENSYNNPIYQSYENHADRTDEMDMANSYMEIVRENIGLDYYLKYADKNERELAEELYQIICDVVCVKRKSVRIGGEDYPYELVKAKLLKLNQGHIEYVMERMKNTTTQIVNIHSYLLTTLYNAPNTMNYYYQQAVQHDLYGGYSFDAMN